MTVSFFGHRQIKDPETVQKQLEVLIENLIRQGASKFFFGGYGEFDRSAYRVVRQKQITAPHLQMCLVLAYLNQTANYPIPTVYPPLESVPKRFAILKRNEWTVKQSDVVIFYLRHEWGGAAKAKEYAVKFKKTIILL